MNGRGGTTAFLPLDSKIGGQVGHVKPNIGHYLTREQANYIYKKVEAGEIINTDTIQQGMEQEEQLNRIDDTNGKTNPYQELIINNAEKVDLLMTQMEQCLILSKILNYVQHNKYYIPNYTLDIKIMNKHRDKLGTVKEEKSIKLNVDDTLLKLCKEYLDRYKCIQTEIVNTSRFNENSDMSTTYLVRSDRARNNKVKAEESFPLSEHGYTSG